MCILDYDFLILDNAFLVHKPGIKKAKKQVQDYAETIMHTNSLLRTDIKSQIHTIYGERPDCAL